MLLVEDNALVREIAAAFLDDAGFAVIEASDAAAALLVVEAGTPFDVLFSDIQMPGPMDGMDLAIHLFARRPYTPILMTSGAAGPARMPPGGRFVAKPYENRAVATLLRELVAA